MSDVLRNAEKYLDQLKFEVAKVDDFLRLASQLMKENQPEFNRPESAPERAVEREANVPMTEAGAKTPSPEQRTDAPSLPSAEEAAPAPAKAAAASENADPAPEAEPSSALFRGAFGPFESERGRNAA